MASATAFPDSGMNCFPIESNSMSESTSRASKPSGDREKKKKKKKDKDKKERKSSKSEKPKEGFDDFFFERNSNDPTDWADFKADKRPPARLKCDDGWNDNQVSQVTHATEALTVSSAGSKKAELPFTTIEVDHAQGQSPCGVVPNPGDSNALAQFHSEMLQGFLKRNGHEATMAVATAAAFENFLKQQHDVMNKLGADGGQSDPFSSGFDEEDRLDALESTLDDERCADSFAPDSIWDEGSVFRDDKAIMMAEYMQQSEKQKKVLHKQEEEQFDEKARMMAEYMQNEQTMKPAPEAMDEEECQELAAYHGEMLQSFLQRHGKGDAVAGQTAVAFESFLKRQQDALGKLSAPGSICSGDSPETKGAGSRGAYSENAAANFQAEDVPGAIPTFIGKPPPNYEFDDRSSLDRDRSVASFHSEGGGRYGRSSRNMIPRQPGKMVAQGFDTRPISERPILEQMAKFTSSQLACYDLLRKQAKGEFTDLWCLRFARCSNFQPKAAQKVMKKFSRHFLDLNIASMEQAMRTRLLYALPGVVGRGGIRMMYMKFNRLLPRLTSVNAFADHLAYVVGCLHETEAACVNGAGIICDMTDFTMNNFSIPYMNKFLMIMQGRSMPVKLQSLLFVNPPKWFGTVWRVMKQMMSSDFLKTKVHRLTFHEMMRHHLPRGCEVVLTNDMFLGRRPAEEIVEEFIAQRKAIESERILG